MGRRIFAVDAGRAKAGPRVEINYACDAGTGGGVYAPQRTRPL